MENYKITLRTLTRGKGESPQTYEMTTTGELFSLKNGCYKIRYNETTPDGTEFKNIVTVKGNAGAKVSRQGEYDTDFTLDTDKKHLCLINTPFGELSFGVLTHAIRNNLTESGGELYFKYTLDANNRFISDNEVQLKITQ
ncbi:MAG: DUF1934 domain-containing protein [Ruminococcus sp.]|jgi:uncharacterized beta-barrel protein YwiB (DUF1934 family)|nr:DUF1934 domain-containing protein [Ruminococcus sp.]